jgi:hypothetical protein
LAAGCRDPKESKTLSELLAAADGIQHAVPTFQEVDGGLARLSAAGLVSVTKGRIGLTANGRDVVSRTGGKRELMSKWEAKLQEALGAAPWSPEYHPAHASREEALASVVSREEYDNAVRGYGV